MRLVLVATLVSLVCAAPARAEVKEWMVSVHPAYAYTLAEDRSLHGGGFGLDVAVGVTENLSLRASGFVAWQAIPGKVGGTASAFSAMAGLHYALDVIRIVPSFDVGVGVLGLRSGARFASDGAAAAALPVSTAFGVELGFAVDYMITRRISAGAVLRYEGALTELDHVPVYLYFGPRVAFRFGG